MVQVRLDRFSPVGDVGPKPPEWVTAPFVGVLRAVDDVVVIGRD